MTERFKFLHDTTDYEVLGNYGQGEKFIVTKFLPDATRMTGASGTPSGATVVAMVCDALTRDELLVKLDNTFSGLANFRSF